MFHHEGGQIFDFLVNDPLLCSTNNRTLHDLAMCSEQVRVRTMLYAFTQKNCTIYEIKTHNCLYRRLKRRQTAILEDITYANPHAVRDSSRWTDSMSAAR